MSKKDICEYRCDVCGKTFPVEVNPLRTHESPLQQMPMPSKKYDCEGRNFSQGISVVDVCQNCYERYWEYAQKRYEVSECYGIEVVVKGE